MGPPSKKRQTAEKRQAVFWCFVAILVATCTGCEPTYKLEPVTARSSLEKFLRIWSEGKPIGSLKSEKPPIIGGDEDWQSGVRLATYKIVETREDGVNLICTVNLTTHRLATDEGSRPIEETKRVEYTVGTQPVVTVFRN